VLDRLVASSECTVPLAARTGSSSQYRSPPLLKGGLLQVPDWNLWQNLCFLRFFFFFRCGSALGVGDYVALAQRYHTICIDALPQVPSQLYVCVCVSLYICMYSELCVDRQIDAYMTTWSASTRCCRCGVPRSFI